MGKCDLELITKHTYETVIEFVYISLNGKIEDYAIYGIFTAWPHLEPLFPNKFYFITTMFIKLFFNCYTCSLSVCFITLSNKKFNSKIRLLGRKKLPVWPSP